MNQFLLFITAHSLPEQAAEMGGAAALILSFVLLVGALILFLLAELYCAFVVKSRLRLSSTAAATSPIRIGEVPAAARLNSLPKAFSNSLYSQGVLGNHRFLFTIKEETLAEETLESPNSSSGFPPNLHFIGLINPRNQIPIPAAISAADPALESGRSSLGDSEEEFICISNPIYEIGIEIDPADQATPPFETPVSSPSKLEDADGDASPVISVLTPPLSPMNLRGSAPPVSLLGNMLSPSWSESSSSVCSSPTW